jgi:hypothetical protein
MIDCVVQRRFNSLIRAHRHFDPQIVRCQIACSSVHGFPSQWLSVSSWRSDPFMPRARSFSFPSLSMSIRLYVGNLPQSFDDNALNALFSSIGEGVRFKTVQDRETGACRGFGFANVDDEKLADTVIEQLNGFEFGGNTLRIERSERRDARSTGGDRRSGVAATGAARKSVNKVVHSDSVTEGAPDPRWAGELAKLKSLLANQTAAV